MGKRYKCIGKCIGVTSEARGLMNHAQIKLKSYIGENVYETNTIAHDGTKLIVFESNKRSMYHINYIEFDNRVTIMNRVVLEKESDLLQEKVRKLFEHELFDLCNKANVDVERLSRLVIMDRETGSEIVGGFAYEDVHELFEWLEDVMNYSYQSIVCNKDGCLAH